MRGIFNTHGQNMSVAQGLRRHATTAGREPTCATRNMPTRNGSRPGPFCQTGRPVWLCKTAHTASPNGPFCTAMTKAKQTGCGSTCCAKCHDMTKNSHHMAPHHVATMQPSHTATPRPQHRKRPARLGDKPGHTENQHKLAAKTTEIGNATASQHAELKHFSCFFIAVCNFIRTFA